MQPFPPPYTPPPYTPPAPAKKSSNTLIWVLGGCGCVSILAIAVFAILLLISLSSGGTIPPDKQAYIGNWQGDGVTLNISGDGKVNWRSQKGNASKSVENLPIQRFIGDDFEVGVGPFTTRFTVQSAPKMIAGRWTMTIEGTTVTRDGGGGSTPDDSSTGIPDGGSSSDGLRDLKMARLTGSNDDDMTFTSTFDTSDTKITCVIYPTKILEGETYGTRWYAERVPRLSRDKLIGEVDFPTITKETSRLAGIRLSLTSDSGFPPGLYRVEVIRDGAVIGTTRFTVQ
ncbi:MAG: hypothetical protein SNJ67_02455 [Chloracidobacterium sp.]